MTTKAIAVADTLDSVEVRDTLTGVYSRNHFQVRLRDEVQRAARYGLSFGLLILDLDHFKSVNDAYGHLRGDEVLAEVGARLRKMARQSDLIFRYGGDEFVLLLPHTAKDQVSLFAERLLEGVRSTPFAGQPPLTLSVSIGAAVFPDDGRSAEALFERADQRHYEAKRSGRGRVIVESSATQEAADFDAAGRLVERDAALETIYHFLEGLLTRRRGLVWVSGQLGVGKSRFLEEISKAAVLRGYTLLQVRGRPGLRTRLYGALAEAQTELLGLTPISSGKPAFIQSLQHNLAERPLPNLLIVVDDFPEVDSATLALLHELLASLAIPILGLVCTLGPESLPRVAHWEAPLKEMISLEPLSAQAVQLGLRSRLQWEAPLEFAEWLTTECGGLPAYLQTGIRYLLNKGVLHKSESGWVLDPAYRTLPLAQRAGRVTRPPLTNLPVMPTNFVGREQEIQKVKDLIESARLVTLLGPGGIGKTRLAIQSAAEVSEQFPQGVYFVPLASVSAVENMPPRIAEALRLSFSGRAEPKLQLLDYLREQNVLLVLDNFEHLTDGRSLVTELFTAAPGVKVIVTSRERLGLQGEAVFELKGLPFPEAAESEPETYSAVQLFLQGARAATGELRLSEGDKAYVARICRLVQGMPLGIELAAAWARMFSYQHIAEAIERNLDFLAQSPAARQGQHNVRAVFDYFWNMLSTVEQQVVRQLSVFRGGFQREAAEQVSGASPFFLSALVDRAFLSQTASGRYMLHELLRQYAEEKLMAVSRERARARDRHSAYYLDFLSRRETELKSSRQRLTLNEIDDELENVRAAWRWGLERGRATEIGQGAESLALYYEIRGLYLEGEAVFEQAISVFNVAPKRSSPGGDRRYACASCQTALGRIFWVKGDFQKLVEVLEVARETWEALGHRRGLAQTMIGLGDAYLEIGEYPRARAYYEQALAPTAKLDDRYLMAQLITHLGILHEDMLEYGKAIEYLEQAVQMSREIGDPHTSLRGLGNLGFVYLEQNDPQRALPYFLECWKNADEIGNTYFKGKVGRELGRSYAKTGDLYQAQLGYAYQLLVALDLNNQRDLAVVLTFLIPLYVQLEKLTEAEQVSRLALIQCRALNVVYWMSEALYSTAELFAKQNRWPEALTTLDEAMNIATRPGGRRDIYLKSSLLLLHGRVKLGLQTLDEAARAGEALLQDSHNEREMAAIAYNIWRLDHTRDSYRQRAAALYGALYQRTPVWEYRKPYEDLTGERLPEPLPLPSLPAEMLHDLPDLETLLARTERRLGG